MPSLQESRPPLDSRQTKLIDKMLYALARSIPRSSFAESVFVGRLVIAATVTMWAGELLALWVLATGRPIALALYTHELELWLFVMGVFLVVLYLTPPAHELERLNVPREQVSRWKRASWWAVAATFLVVPFALIIWASYRHGALT